ncbi:hypothetical protein DGo_PA0323 (plasmid) [Deinococcus gobiensis I-0]|uniref:Uncharacterized protein n=1 Tax=Deinococcus gobiensis (strain DSM 21396 / JCM 16679 / CGMCC 1.7299 / I-0) TaxID=745776 RepID=H8H0F7_DEIGI|nr:hypothetical protein DGo_PA0323 [Deinococcus gobiensis I-0]
MSAKGRKNASWQSQSHLRITEAWEEGSLNSVDTQGHVSIKSYK